MPCVLIVGDHPGASAWLADVFEARGYSTRTAVGVTDAIEELEDWSAQIICLDVTHRSTDAIDWLGQLKTASATSHVMIASSCATVQMAVDAMRAGALIVVETSADPNTWFAAVEQAVRDDARSMPRFSDTATEASFAFAGMIGASDGMRRLFQLIGVVAPTDATVLIHGENGTGKELVAAAIHDHGPRASQPFIKINCAAIPADLMESELFGHCKGAFTGAIGDKVGLMELAAGGSLLLDEIAEMPLSLQVKLLRVLQEREFRPVGGHRVIRATFRLISATNADVTAALSEGRLREDLYFRINTVLLTIPPLRERPEDIALLLAHFQSRFASQYGRRVTAIAPEAMDALMRYRWPGNVRELENVVERAVIVAKGSQVSIDDLPASLRIAEEEPRPILPTPTCHTLAEIEKRAILETLEQTSWNKRRAANILGLYRPTLYSKLRKHHINPQHGTARRSSAVRKDRTTNG